MAGIWVYVPGEAEGAIALRSRLNALAGALGYVSPGGPTRGEGSLTRLLLAIDAGEVALVLLTDDERRKAREALVAIAAQDPFHGSWAHSILVALDAAADRQSAADVDEVLDS